MKPIRTLFFPLIAPLIALILTISIPAYSQATKSAPNTPKGHRDHNPKHGGTFFMALDMKHHLEGVLERPGTFRVYLYDAISRPEVPARVKLASGKVEWGDSDPAPQTPLKLSKDGRTLEAAFEKANPPITVTLRVRFPGSPLNSRPELFTFIFRDYSVEPPSLAKGHSATAPITGKQPPSAPH
jgi:hypothetical protein